MLKKNTFPYFWANSRPACFEHIFHVSKLFVLNKLITIPCIVWKKPWFCANCFLILSTWVVEHVASEFQGSSQSGYHKCVPQSGSHRCVSLSGSQKCVSPSGSHKCISQSGSNKCVSQSGSHKWVSQSDINDLKWHPQASTIPKITSTLTFTPCFEPTCTLHCVLPIFLSKCILLSKWMFNMPPHNLEGVFQPPPCSAHQKKDNATNFQTSTSAKCIITTKLFGLMFFRHMHKSHQVPQPMPKNVFQSCNLLLRHHC